MNTGGRKCIVFKNDRKKGRIKVFENKTIKSIILEDSASNDKKQRDRYIGKSTERMRY